MIAFVKGIALLHLAGEWSGYWAVPAGLVLLAILLMLLVLVRDAIRRALCPHDDVRFIRQQRGYEFYFAEVCMHCRKSSGAKP